MTNYFVSRHQGAIEWARQSNLHVDIFVAHLDPTLLKAGDCVIGTLPVHLAAEVCERGAQYIHLILDLPAASRGQELSAQALNSFNARLSAFHVQKLADHVYAESIHRNIK